MQRNMMKQKKPHRFWHNRRVLVTGGAGFLGRYVVEALQSRGALVSVPRKKTADLRDQIQCRRAVTKQQMVVHLAGNVGGIGLNQKKPGELFYDNLTMGVHLMEEARKAGVEKFVAIGTICAYPKWTPVPFSEDRLWDGYPEETNAPYGLAKKMLLVQAQAYRQQYGFNAIYLLPVNLYGPRDNFDPASSHVIPALIRKIAEAKRKKKKEVIVWGSGKVTREFLYVGDAAEGIVLASEHYDKTDPVNLGTGVEISIKELVKKISQIIGYTGRVVWDQTKPDGQPRRCVDVSRAWDLFMFRSSTPFSHGLKRTIDWYISEKT